MKNFVDADSAVYCDYTVFLNESFERFCEMNGEWLKEKGIRLIVPQPVIDEIKAVPMSRMDDYILCCQGMERINAALEEGIVCIGQAYGTENYSEDYFYRLCRESDRDMIIVTSDIQLAIDLAEVCEGAGRKDGFLTVLEIEENGMVHRLR